MAATRKLTRTHQVPALDFRAEFQPATMDADKRTVQVTWTTGARVLRGGFFTDPFYEELSLNPAHVRMGRLQSGAAPLLNAHNNADIADVIGVVEGARLDPGGKTGSASVRFDSGIAGSEAMRKVKEGILRNVSVGYRVHKLEQVKGATVDSDDDTPTFRATDWEPYELSMVPIGADAGAATRSVTATNPCEFTEERAMDPEKPTPTATVNPAPVVTEAQRAAAATAERERVLGIQGVARKLGTPEAEVNKAIASDMTLDAFRARAIDLREVAPPELGGTLEAGGGQGGIRVQQVGMGHEKWVRAIEAAIFQRMGSMTTGVLRAYAEKTGEKIDLDPGEFRGARTLDIARLCLERSGHKYRGMEGMGLLGKALTEGRRSGSDDFFTNRAPAQSIGDFPLILENVMHKLLLAAYGVTPDTWRSMCTIGTAVDFRPNPRYRMGSLSVLTVLNELGEFTNKALSDAEKQTITVATKGNILALSRQLLLNDDMSALSRVAMMFGRAAALSIEVDFYALLAQNAGLGPNLYDGNAMFYASRASGSNIGTGSALGSNALDADRVVMKSMKDPSGNEVLDIRPSILLVPAGLGGNARQIVNGQYDFDAVTKAAASRSTYQIPNQVGGIFKDVIDTARLTGTRRYLFADPAVYPVFETIFLDGQQQPYMEMQQGWRLDGVEWKIRLDYAVGGVDFRGAVTNAGA